jgi:hypothetical protein
MIGHPFDISKALSRGNLSMKLCTPIYTTFGLRESKKTALVISPVMPSWDAGAFLAPLTGELVRIGYFVIVADSLSILNKTIEVLDGLIYHWHNFLKDFRNVDLLVGCALGGTIVQGLLKSSWAKRIPKVLLLSAPTKSDELLNRRLGLMSDLAGAQRINEAMTLLNRLVLPAHQANVRIENASFSSVEESQACFRLETGFRLLLDVDMTPSVESYDGLLLSIYGQQSQLVRDVNIVTRNSEKQRSVSIINGGMRPLTDCPEAVFSEMRTHLGIEVGEVA